MSEHFRSPYSGFQEDQQYQQQQESANANANANAGLNYGATNRSTAAHLANEEEFFRRQQERMSAASMLDYPAAAAAAAAVSSSGRQQGGFLLSDYSGLQPSGSYLPQMGASRASMASWQDPLDARGASSFAARMTQAQMSSAASAAQLQQQMRMQAQAHLFQQEQAQARAQEEFEFNRMLREKRNIDDMLFSPTSRGGGGGGHGHQIQMQMSMPMQMGMDSMLTNTQAGPRRSSFLGGQPGGSMNVYNPMMNDRSSMLNAHQVNVSNRPVFGGEQDLGKIRHFSGGVGGGGGGDRSAAYWAEQSRHLSDSTSFRSSSSLPGGIVLEPPAAGYDETFEEDDETYFNEAGTDEVDRDFKRSQENFPLKLYRIIYESVQSGKGDIISFLPHGRAFAVHKPKEFLSQIMPKCFGTGTPRFNTFLKQLNLYGFKRITEGRDKGGYFHPNFIKGQRSRCRMIKRKKTDSKPSKSAAASSSKPIPRKAPPQHRSSEEEKTSSLSVLEQQRLQQDPHGA